MDQKSYRKLIVAARHLSLGYAHPKGGTVSNKLVPAEYHRIKSFIDARYAELGTTKGAVCADGATVVHRPLLNGVVLLPDLAPIVEEIVDASAHIAAGGKKDADYQV